MSRHSQRSTGKQKGHPHSAKLAGAALLIGVPQDWFVRIKGQDQRDQDDYPAAGRGANDTCDLIRRLLSGWERAPPFERRDHAPHFVQAWV